MSDQSRRRLLKSIAAGSGAVIAGKSLPESWLKPVVESAVLPLHADSSPPEPEPSEPVGCEAGGVLPTVTTTSATDGFVNAINGAGNVTNEGSCPVTERGIVYSTSQDPTLADLSASSGAGPGAFSINDAPAPGNMTYYLRAYATSLVGTAYGNELSTLVSVCLSKGTLVSLRDSILKPIEELDYSDELLVWNFDLARFATARPLYIKRPETTMRYNLLVFSDHSTLKTINQHRIFNREKGRFTYPMTDDTPVGTHTFNVHGAEVTLVHKEVIYEQVEYFNVITDHHLNLFGNGILTSVGYNNLYPIVDMKFVKDDRAAIPRAAYGDIPDKYYRGLRLAEQRDIPVADTRHYIAVREALAKEAPLESGNSRIVAAREHAIRLRV